MIRHLRRPAPTCPPPPHRRLLHVLGIESSCDDVGISVVDYGRRRVLSEARSADHSVHSRVRGILPYASAEHHRKAIPRLVEQVLVESGVRASGLDALAVTTRPGLVLSLKAGVDYALGFAREFRRPLLPVHHMRAHSLLARLLEPQLDFPFASLLLSGAHCLVCHVSSPFRFHILVDSAGGSPGECLDKLARELAILPQNGHYGAALEEMAGGCPSPEDHLPYRVSMPYSSRAEFNFDSFKRRYLPKIRKWAKDSEKPKANICAGIQHSVIEHVCQHLEPALAFAAHGIPEFVSNTSKRKLVVSGGVAANCRFLERIREVASIHKFAVFVPPPHLCSDNGVMVAWTGAEIFSRIGNSRGRAEEEDNKDEGQPPHIYWPDELPDSIWTSHKAAIGPRMEWDRWGQREGREEPVEGEELAHSMAL